MSFPLVAAHTGCGISPDNTVASFMEGINSGADIVEVDVHASRDDVALLMHDESPYLQTHTFEQLNDPEVRAKIDLIYEKEEIVALEHIIQLSEPHGIQLNLDLKSDASIGPTAQLIRKYGLQKKAFITGFMTSVTQRYPDLQVMLNTPAALTLEQTEHPLAFAQKICHDALTHKYVGLNMNYKTCFPHIVEMAHAEGLTVCVYTVNEESLMQQFIEMGVDVITTRQPELLLSLVKKAKDYER